MFAGFLFFLVLLIWPMLSDAQYSFRTIDVPFAGATDTSVTGRNSQGDLVGSYRDTRGNFHGFLAPCGSPVFPLLSVIPRGINDAGVVAGFYLATSGQFTGFLYQDGTFTSVLGPRGAKRRFPLLTELLHIGETHVIGTYRSADEVNHGLRGTLLDIFERLETIDVPDTKGTALLYVSPQGRLLVRALGFDDVTRYLVRETDGTWTLLDLPDLPEIDLVGRLDNGALVGNTGSRSFVLQNGTVTLITVPESTLTQLFGTQEDGTLYGRFTNAQGDHGFLAVPDGVADACDDVEARQRPQDKEPREKKPHTRPR